MDNTAVTLALIGIVGTVITALFKLLQANTQAQVKTAETNALIAEETKLSRQEAELGRKAQEKGFREAKQRNGHLGEQSHMIATLITKQNEDVRATRDSNKKIESILSKSALIAAEDRDTLTSPNQHIGEQIVEHQVVKDKK